MLQENIWHKRWQWGRRGKLSDTRRRGEAGLSRWLSGTFPNRLPGSTHPYKYRLYYGQADGSCLVRYDNERGKGDHRHVGDTEETYSFSTLLKLIEDFEADIERM